MKNMIAQALLSVGFATAAKQCAVIETSSQYIQFTAHAGGIRTRVVPLEGNFTIRDDLYHALVDVQPTDDCVNDVTFTNGNLRVDYEVSTDLLTYRFVSSQLALKQPFSSLS